MTAGKTSDDEIDILIQRAIKIAEKVPEQYRLKAFEVVLSNLLVYPIFEKKEGQERERADVRGFEEKVAEFAAKCNLSIAQLRSVFEFQDDKPVFIIHGLGGTHAERQVQVSRYLLAAYSEVYGKEWVKLVQVLEDHGIGSLGNLAKNLKKYPTIFNVKGQGKGTEYKLVEAAKRETFGLINGFAPQHDQ
jgi:hypothetical protein